MLDLILVSVFDLYGELFSLGNLLGIKWKILLNKYREIYDYR